MSNRSFGLAFHEVEPKAAAADIAIWSTLLLSFVVQASSMSADEYYTEMFRVATARLRHTQPEVTPTDYVARMNQVATKWSDLLDANSFAVLVTEDNTRQAEVSGQIALIQAYASHLEGEAGAVSFVAGYLKTEVGLLAEGTLLVRCSSHMATVLHVIPYLRFDPGANRLLRLGPTDAEQADAADLTSDPLAREEVPWDFILNTLSTICQGLQYAPKVGPVFAILNEGIEIVQFIRGSLAENEHEAMLRALKTFIHDTLTDFKIREQLAHLDAFLDSYNKHNRALKYSTNKPRYIREEFLPTLEAATISLSGTVDNTLAQLNKLWQDTPWESIKYAEQILQALALATGYRLLAYKTKVLLRSELAADAKRRGDENGYQIQSAAMHDAFRNYEYVVNSSTPSARDLLKRARDYKTKRHDSSSVYWSYHHNFVVSTTFDVWDRLDRDRCLDYCTFYGTWDEGAGWARRTRDRHYNEITTESNGRYVPIIEKAKDMIVAFQQMAIQINNGIALESTIYYKITAVDSQQVLDVEGPSTEQGGSVIRYSYHGGKNQLWRFVALEGADAGYYAIYSAYSNHCLDLSGCSSQEGTRLIQWPYGGGDNQKFQPVAVGDGRVVLQVKHSGQALDVAERNVVQRHRNDGKHQQLRLEAISVIDA